MGPASAHPTVEDYNRRPMFQSLYQSLSTTFGGWFPTIIGIAGLGLLVLGGHWLVAGAVTIARRLGMPMVVVGLTIVAAGTSAPELFFNLIAASKGHIEMCFGNVVGSNIANIGLVLGICALVAPLTVHSGVLKRELPWLLGVSGLMLALAWAGPRFAHAGALLSGFTRWDGILLLALFVAILWFWWREAKKGSADPLVREAAAEAKAEAIGTLWGACIVFVIGVAALFVGGEFAREGAVGVARQLGMSEALIGLTVVAIATSLPEVAASLQACRKGYCDLAIGNVVGSNLFNILLVLGATSTNWSIPVPSPWGWYDLWAMLALTIVLFPIALTNQRRITRWEGGSLLVLYASYMSFSILR